MSEQPEQGVPSEEDLPMTGDDGGQIVGEDDETGADASPGDMLHPGAAGPGETSPPSGLETAAADPDRPASDGETPLERGI